MQIWNSNLLYIRGGWYGATLFYQPSFFSQRQSSRSGVEGRMVVPIGKGSLYAMGNEHLFQQQEITRETRIPQGEGCDFSNLNSDDRGGVVTMSSMLIELLATEDEPSKLYPVAFRSKSEAKQMAAMLAKKLGRSVKMVDLFEYQKRIAA